MIVWLVGSDSRKAKLEQYIAECREMPEHSKGIFTVIMRDKFEALICSGAEALKGKGGE